MRSKSTPIRPTVTDAVYHSQLVAKLINGCMKSGKKSIAAGHVYKTMDIIKAQFKIDPLEYLTDAIEKIKPTIEVRSRRVGGASYQVPTPIRPERRQSLAIRWLVDAARARSNSGHHTFADKLAAEIIEAHEEQGNTIKKKMDIHRMAEANKAFAHFRW